MTQKKHALVLLHKDCFSQYFISSKVILAGFAELSKTSVVHMCSLFHAFILCQLWTVYLEQIIVFQQNHPGGSSAVPGGMSKNDESGGLLAGGILLGNYSTLDFFARLNSV